MKYLLDTHIVIWLLFDFKKIPLNLRKIIEDPQNDIYISKISLWEISLKYGLGKLKLNNSTPDEIENILTVNGYQILDFKSEEALSFYKLPQKIHKDPFDKMLVWQAIRNELIFLSADKKLKVYASQKLKIEF